MSPRFSFIVYLTVLASNKEPAPTKPGRRRRPKSSTQQPNHHQHRRQRQPEQDRQQSQSPRHHHHHHHHQQQHQQQQSPRHQHRHYYPKVETDTTLDSGSGQTQMINNSIGGSQIGSDPDPIKDAQDTAEDSAILKRFKIIQLVGIGNYARVYKALAPSGRELAIKSINLTKSTDNYKLKFLPRELTILKRISHHNICKVHEILQVSDRVFIIMQFCSKGTIADLLHKCGPLSEPVVRHLFSQTAGAVAYLHGLDLAHRDLKVENILLDHDYSPKLTDFSYSISTLGDNSQPSRAHKSPTRSPIVKVSSKTNPASVKHSTYNSPQSPKAQAIIVRLNETFCGTLPYLSPEMVRQQPYDSKKTDVWSLGVCLFVMANDRLPFPFDDIKAMIKKQLTKDYKFRANIDYSPEIKDLVSLMLEPDYIRRLNASDIIQHSWFNGHKEKPSSV